jgi:trk system potassium uptake protein TrkH
MNFLEAVCHTFTAVATGGFSTRNASVGAFGPYSQTVLIVIMLLGGANFALHYYVLRGRPNSYWRSDELRCYLYILAGAIVIAFVFNWTLYDKPIVNLRDAIFTVTSILTTTGFATADYERWPVLVQAVLFALMFVGGCAGSTAGGLKQVRHVLLVKHAFQQTARLIHPRQVSVLKLDGRPVSDEIMQDVLGFTVLFFGLFLVATLLLTATGVDLVTAGSAVIACASTVGPGLGEVGPLDNYAWLPPFSKIVLIFVMLLGRLEISTVLVLLFISFWKK